jgi:hypothetical protein
MKINGHRVVRHDFLSELLLRRILRTLRSDITLEKRLRIIGWAKDDT